MTISPPSNVKLDPGEPGRVLASGIDSLYLAIDVKWQDDAFFMLLDEAKELAKSSDAGTSVDLYYAPGEFATANVQGYGKKGYEFLLVGREFAMKIGQWLDPKSRPSVMVELRAEALWHQGPMNLVARICSMLEGVRATILRVKPSRVDICADLLLPASVWKHSIRDHIVCRATKIAQYTSNRKFSGIAIGGGAVQARLYDKPLEIATVSNKVWMYDIWGIEAVPEGHVIIRAEFQLTREALKEMKLDSFEDLMANLSGLWAYCTKRWLKFQDDPRKHHTQQTTEPWWKIAQDGFQGVQAAKPIVREKAVRADRRQLLQQLLGQLASWMALEVQGFELNGERSLSIAHSLGHVREAIAELGVTNQDFTDKVKLKFAKYRRIEPPKE